MSGRDSDDHYGRRVLPRMPDALGDPLAVLRRRLNDAFNFINKMSNWGGIIAELIVKAYFKDQGLESTVTGKVVLFICKMIINSVLSALGLFMLYLIFFCPYAVRPCIAAAVAAFNLAPTGTGTSNTTLQQLHYDVALNVTFFNDHRIWAIRFNHFSGRLYFDGTNISPPDTTVTKFKGRTRRHRTVHLLLRGRATSVVSAAMADEFSRERAQGWFAIEIRLKSTLTYVIWPTRYVYYYEYDCWLHFPSNATLPVVIGPAECSKGKQFGLSYVFMLSFSITQRWIGNT